MNSRLVLSLVVACAMTAGVVAGWWAQRHGAPTDLERASAFDNPRPLTPFTLIADNGGVLDRSALQGGWTLVFLGFTHCPDICPTTLLTLAQSRKQMRDDVRLQVLLVSVDPERDTPEVLAEYVRHFDTQFAGATGERDAIERFAAQLGGVFIRTPLAQGGYTVDHTAALFLLDPQVRLAAVFSAPHDAAVLARDLQRIVDRYQGSG